MTTVAQISMFASVLLVGSVSLAGAFLLSIREKFLKKILLYLVSFATGALLANVFLHLLPESLAEGKTHEFTLGLVLAGVVGSFVLEKFVHWHHCHTSDCEGHHRHLKPAGRMLLIADGLHNMTDGILIVTTYLVSIPPGVATTLAIALHELPQELGDFAVLIHSGYSRKRALLLNFATALTALIGAILALFLHQYVENIEVVLLPLIAGNFLYIAGSDLVPELHKESRPSKAFLQVVCLVAGIAFLYFLAGMNPAH